MDTETPESVPPGPPDSRPAIGAFDGSCYAVPYELLPSSIRDQRKALGLPGAGMEFKSLQTEMKALREKRRVEIWVAAYGNVDLVGEVIPYGAAADSIKAHGPRAQGGSNQIKFMFNHALLLGPALVVEEHKEGIFMVGAVDPVPDLDRYLAHAESGAVDKGSIGYVVKRRSKTTVRGEPAISLDQIEMFEGSEVIWPANMMTGIEAVKSWRAKSLDPGAAAPARGDRKSFYGLSETVCALQRLQDALHTLRWAQESEYAQLTADERAAVEVFLDILTTPPSDVAESESTLAAVLRAVTAIESSKGLKARAADPSRDPRVLASLANLKSALRAPLS